MPTFDFEPHALEVNINIIFLFVIRLVEQLLNYHYTKFCRHQASRTVSAMRLK